MLLNPTRCGMLIAGIISISVLHAQVPQGISYQAIARTLPDGDELVNTPMTVRLGVLNQSLTLEYEETHSTSSNEFGLINLAIGQGISTGNGMVVSFDEILWGSGSHFVNVEIDYPGSNGFEVIGQSELLSVPYALYSEMSGIAAEIDGDIGNELINSVSYDLSLETLTITEGGISMEVMIPSDDADANPGNELITGLALSSDFQTLQIDEGGNALSLNLEAVIEGTWQKDNGNVYNQTEQIGVGTNTPGSTFHVNGSYSAAVQVIMGTSLYDLTDLDQMLICNVTDGPVTINLPLASSAPGRMYTIRKTYDENIDPFTSNSVMLVTYGGELIDFSTTYLLNWVKQESVVVISDGNQWYVLNYTRDEI